MPFTLSHVAAAMPMRHTRLILSAVIVGTMAPDLEYFIRLSPGGGWGHTMAGAFGLSLPLGLAVLWLFHRFAKAPVIALLPASLERRLGSAMQPFPFLGLRRLLWIVVSLLAGIATHIAWDLMTHRRGWIYNHWSLLHQRVPLPLLHRMHVYTFLQIGSSVAGLVIVGYWIFHWYQVTPPGPVPQLTIFTPSQKTFAVAVMIALSMAGGLLRGWIHAGSLFPLRRDVSLAGDIVVTSGALLWWQLVAWGVLMKWRVFHPAAQSETTTR